MGSGKLGKYENLTGEDLAYRPDPVQKAKFEFSPLGQVFNKGLDASEKQEGLLRRLKNIEGKTNNQLDLIRDQGDRQLYLIDKTYIGKTDALKFENEENKKYNSNKYTHLGDLTNRIYDKELSFDEAKNKQEEFLEEIEELNKRIEPKIGKQTTDANKKKHEKGG